MPDFAPYVDLVSKLEAANIKLLRQVAALKQHLIAHGCDNHDSEEHA